MARSFEVTIGTARKGHPVTEETREKIRRTLAETRAKKKALQEG
jgi:hypothetical protein